jgi:hypothetical protein
MPGKRTCSSSRDLLRTRRSMSSSLRLFEYPLMPAALHFSMGSGTVVFLSVSAAARASAWSPRCRRPRPPHAAGAHYERSRIPLCSSVYSSNLVGDSGMNTLGLCTLHVLTSVGGSTDRRHRKHRSSLHAAASKPCKGRRPL